MSKPDDIPQDVWDRAASFMERSYSYGAKEFVARAILAERERCEAICMARAEYHKRRRHQYDDGESQTSCLEAALEALDCASAIRKGGE